MKNVAKLLFARLATSERLKLVPGFFVSFALHMTVLLGLALIVLHLAPPIVETNPVEVFGNDGPEGKPDAIDHVEFAAETGDKSDSHVEANTISLDKLPALDAVSKLNLQEGRPDAGAKLDLGVGPTVRFAGELAGRSGGARAKLVSKGGGSSGSERAVSRGLRWLARHQKSDGSWNFHHGADDPGSLDKCTTAATGLAVLTYLGAGHTHRDDQVRYRANVDHGLHYLVTQMKRDKLGGDLRGQVVSNEGMYAQAIATLALCEAYGLTRDAKFKDPAQRAINFIVAAQDPKGGGWRYSPREPGDTTVTGWQIMALKSAKGGNLAVPEQTLARARHFLDSVQAAGGSRYGYVSPGEDGPMTAIGLLCRMYLGWTRNDSPLKNGVEYLSHRGPSPNDIYYDYYATQVLHHWGGAEWKKWNDVLRDHLIETQIKEGDAAGSWKPTADRGASTGGRLYQTCLSVMTLEVYYRYLPLYQKESGKPTF